MAGNTLIDLPTEQLESEITELAANLYAASARWTALLGEFDRREAWRAWGCKSCAHWLSWRCGIVPGAAREQIRVARALPELPAADAAFASGELSYSKVRAITRVATPATEEHLVDIARHSTAAQLERVVRSYRGVTTANVDAAQAAHAKRYLEWRWDDDGSLTIRGRLSPEDGAAFVVAIEAATESDRQRVSAETPERFAGVGGASDSEVAEQAVHPHRVGRGALAADALARLVTDPSHDAPPKVPELVLHVDVATLSDDVIHERCDLEHGPSIPPETARRLSCDAAVVEMRECEGKVLDVGRRTRTVPPAMRRALHTRDDGRCRFPGCDRRRSLHAHHLQHWARGGPTSRDNLVLLCPFHHRLVHEGGFDAAREGDEILFRTPDGERVPDVPAGARGTPEMVVRQNAAGGLELDARTCIPEWRGEHLDLGYVVSGLCEMDARGSPG